jgi:ABC-type glycerol-3-phosphate transport system substrate-binding protein
MNANPNTRGAKRLVLATLVVAGLALASCGGDDEGSGERSSETVTVSQVTECFEDAGQKVREVDVSFAKLPPDIDVSSRAGSADVWVVDDEAGTQAVIDQEEELARLDPAASVTPVEDKVVQSGNAIAVVSSDSSPDYRATIEECIPPPS